MKSSETHPLTFGVPFSLLEKRSKQPAFSVVEAEELIESIICLFLDRQFQGLLVLLNDCMQAIVNYFTDQEWHSSCENIAKFVASWLLLLLVSIIVIQ